MNERTHGNNNQGRLLPAHAGNLGSMAERNFEFQREVAAQQASNLGAVGRRQGPGLGQACDGNRPARLQ
eukprot:3001512-Lingulodinium_polyedra.AAC.1